MLSLNILKKQNKLIYYTVQIYQFWSILVFF